MSCVKALKKLKDLIRGAGEKAERARKREKKAQRKANNRKARIRDLRESLDRAHDRLAKASPKERAALEVVIRDLEKQIVKKRTARDALFAKANARGQRANFWLKKQTIYRKQWKKAKRRLEPKFEVWMLNGHPNTIDEDLKPVVAFLVVERKQTITSTSDGGHSTSSYHYPRNNSDGECHAVDAAGPNMATTAERVKVKFGTDWLELLSPAPWYIKHGTIYPGYFPAHGDHGHYAKA